MASLMGQWYTHISGLISGGKTFENVNNLATGLAVDIRECRRGVYVLYTAQRLRGRLAEA